MVTSNINQEFLMAADYTYLIGRISGFQYGVFPEK